MSIVWRWIRTRRKRVAGGLVLLALAAPLVVGEIRQLVIDGHLGLGLHADLLRRHADIGVPGITQMYSVRGTNLTPFPMLTRVCVAPNDTGPDRVYRYSVEKWNRAGRRWDAVMSLGPGDCGPFFKTDYPGADEFGVKWQVLWPGQSADLVTWEATSARAGLQKGDRARFRVLALFDSPDDRWFQVSIPSAEMQVTEEIDPAYRDIGFRIKH